MLEMWASTARGALHAERDIRSGNGGEIVLLVSRGEAKASSTAIQEIFRQASLLFYCRRREGI